MSNNIKFKLNYAGVGELLKSGEMQAVVNGLADSAANSLGDGFEAEHRIGAKRCYANVRAVTREAKKKNSETNCLLKAVGC